MMKFLFALSLSCMVFTLNAQLTANQQEFLDVEFDSYEEVSPKLYLVHYKLWENGKVSSLFRLDNSGEFKAVSNEYDVLIPIPESNYFLARPHVKTASEKSHKVGIIAEDDKIILDYTYDNIYRPRQNIVVTKLDDDNYGLFNLKTKQIVEPVYDKIVEVDDNKYKVVLHNKSYMLEFPNKLEKIAMNPVKGSLTPYDDDGSIITKKWEPYYFGFDQKDFFQTKLLTFPTGMVIQLGKKTAPEKVTDINMGKNTRPSFGSLHIHYNYPLHESYSKKQNRSYKFSKVPSINTGAVIDDSTFIIATGSVLSIREVSYADLKLKTINTHTINDAHFTDVIHSGQDIIVATYLEVKSKAFHCVLWNYRTNKIFDFILSQSDRCESKLASMVSKNTTVIAYQLYNNEGLHSTLLKQFDASQILTHRNENHIKTLSTLQHQTELGYRLKDLICTSANHIVLAMHRNKGSIMLVDFNNNGNKSHEISSIPKDLWGDLAGKDISLKKGEAFTIGIDNAYFDASVFLREKERGGYYLVTRFSKDIATYYSRLDHNTKTVFTDMPVIICLDDDLKPYSFLQIDSHKKDSFHNNLSPQLHEEQEAAYRDNNMISGRMTISGIYFVQKDKAVVTNIFESADFNGSYATFSSYDLNKEYKAK